MEMEMEMESYDDGYMQLLVRPIAGATFALFAQKDDSVALLKSRLEDRVGIPIDRQRLLYGSTTLQDSWQLNECGVEHASCLTLSLTLPGGSAVGAEGGRESLLLPASDDMVEQQPEDKPMMDLIRECAEPFEDIGTVDLSPLMSRIGDARVVLLGESTHGTDEFYRMRARITQELITKKGFTVVAAEGDWPDSEHVNRYISGQRTSLYNLKERPFSRFPTWLWCNAQFADFVDWLRMHNMHVSKPEQAVGLYGLDLYSMFQSMEAVITYLTQKEPDLGALARQSYGAFARFAEQPHAYGRWATTYESLEDEVISMLVHMLNLQMSSSEDQFLHDAVQHARIVANAEMYYRAVYSSYGSSWNVRESHMFETLESLLQFKGPDSKVVLWAHNCHVGNSEATGKKVQGQYNLGQLCKHRFGDESYLIGFGTHNGSVAAASHWGADMQIFHLNPSRVDSYENIFHRAGIGSCLLPLRLSHNASLLERLAVPKLERAIGVIYKNQDELQNHYFMASLPDQFDEFIFFDRTHSVIPLCAREQPNDGMPITFPSGV